MKKEDFRYEFPEKYLKEVYVFENDDYLLTISEDIYDDETIKYANNVCEKYTNSKNDILNHMLESGLREAYQSFNYTDEFIKENIGKPQIQISMKKTDANPNWKFDYFGTLVFLEHKLDEHIIDIEFTDELKLKDHISMNG